MAPLRHCLAALLAVVTACLATSVEVDTQAGRLRGKWMTSSQGRPIAAFEGIPYARPPLGDLRFEAPVRADAWDGVRDAVKPGSSCVQRNVFLRFQHVEGDEDCLYLNVYAPETVTRSDPLPVMVYIHGGGFMVGCGHDQGPEHLLNRDVVYVSINYRLGPLGFLSTGDSVIRGNFGLKDQVLALQWVRDNIAAFGGNPDLVTIIGESAGAGSVHFHTLSPLSRGLFHRAIMMSGSALAPWAFDDTHRAQAAAKKLAGLVQCPSDSSDDLKRCLRGKSAEELISTDYSYIRWVAHPLVPFRPTAEAPGPEAFLDRHPLEAYSSGMASNVPFLTGFTKHEGCLAAVPIIEWSEEYLKDLDQRFPELGALMFNSENLPDSVNHMAFSQARQLYFGEQPIDRTVRSELIDFFSDTFFIVSSLETAKLQKKASSAPVYVYELEHYSSRSFVAPLGGSDYQGLMSHGDDLLHLFPLAEIFPEEPSAEDRVFSSKLVDLFTTFATIGRPTQEDSWRSVENGAKAEYAHVTSKSLEMLSDFAPQRMRLWRDLPVNMALASPRPQAREEL